VVTEEEVPSGMPIEGAVRRLTKKAQKLVVLAACYRIIPEDSGRAHRICSPLSGYRLFHSKHFSVRRHDDAQVDGHIMPLECADQRICVEVR